MIGWSITKNALQKTFVFKDFTAAWGFMSQVAQKADTMNHHPEWCNIYNRVNVTLTTHDAGNSVQDNDWKLAKFMDKISAQYK